MIRVHLSTETREAVQALRRDPTLSPVERDRVEMIFLSDTGWSPPRIAEHLNYHAKTVRLVLDRFNREGLSSLRRHRPGPPRDVARREQVTSALDRLLEQDRTWTAAQLAEALSDEGIHLSTRQTRKYLQPMARWRRTTRTLRHKQDEARVERARGQLTTLKKRLPKAASS